MTRHYLFVYGTLKAGEPLHHLLLDKGYVDSDTRFVGSATTVSPFPMVIASKYNIPFVLDREGTGNRIHGEVYSVTPGTLERLDQLEWHPEYYERRPVQVSVGAADPDTSSSSDEDAHPRILTADMYVFHNFDPKLLELPMLSSYSATGSHGLEYVHPDKRVAEEVHLNKWEVKRKASK